MVANPRSECLRRATWYLNRIHDLQREMTSKPVLDGDDVEQCQSMLREIRARFRADQRELSPGQVLSQIEMNFRNVLAMANDALRIPMASRPAGRWRVLLAECEGHIRHFTQQMEAAQVQR